MLVNSRRLLHYLAMLLYRDILFSITRFQLLGDDIQSARAALSQVVDWQKFIGELELNGLAVLFYRHAQANDLSVPDEAMRSLRALVMRHTAISKARYQAMSDLDVAFAEAEIPWLALKGLALAPTLFNEVADRPMRDVDLLVPHDLLDRSGDVMRELGYHLPKEQPSKYMRGTHQLPNAELMQNGFKISVEVHHNAIGQDAVGSLEFSDIHQAAEIVQWDELTLRTLPKEIMLHQLCRHLAGFHPGGNMKLVNVLDVVGFAERNHADLDWSAIRQQYPHVLTTLRCVHAITPLSDALTETVGGKVGYDGDHLGVIMHPLSWIFSSRHSWRQRGRLLFNPSDWWLHMYYSIDPDKSLLWIKCVKHPLKIGSWLLNRLLSRLLGG